MSSPTPAQRSRMTVACGPVPCETEEGRRFLQERLALFGQVAFILAFAHYVYQRVVHVLDGAVSGTGWLGDVYDHLQLAVCGVFLLIWTVCRFGRRSRFQLSAVDTLGVFLVGALLGVRCSETGALRGAEFDWVALLSMTNVLLARAVIVPSSAGQTLVTGTLAAFPVLTGSFTASASGLEWSVHSGWMALPVALATVASRVIYGLRQEVQEAKQFGQYTLEEKIGSGGMGEVYRASHALLRRPTALKLLRPEAAGEKNLARFEREVQLTSRLSHPNTVMIYDYGRTPEGIFYYAMEYLDGVHLERLVQIDGPQPASRVIAILEQVCSSLAEAHDTGLIHRDIKPANIILCERGGQHDVVKVVDFGLVKALEPEAGITVSSESTITGTPLYLSPEGIRAPSEVDARSDLYAVGAVGYYLLTGKPLFESQSFMEICSHHLHTRPVPPSRRVDLPVPSDLEGLLLMCLEKRPGDRPRDARALRAALQRCRDAGGWTDEDAAAWWRRHGAEARAATGSRAADESSAAPTASLPGAGPTPAGYEVATAGKAQDRDTG